MTNLSSANSIILKHRGFTLVELLVVISIIGLLSSVVLAALNGARQKGQTAAVIQFTDNNYHKLGVNTALSMNFNEGVGASQTPQDQTGNFTFYASSSKIPESNINSFNGSTYFDNSTNDTGFIMVPTSGSAVNLSDTSGITFSVWFNAPSGDTSIYYLIRTSGHDNTSANDISLMSYVSPNSNLAYCSIGGFLASTTVVADGNWHNITCNYSAAGPASVLAYLDGKPSTPNLNVGSYSFTSLAGPVGGPYALPIYIASFNGATNKTFNGLIDNLQIFSGSLTASQVGKLYAEGLKTHQMAEAK